MVLMWLCVKNGLKNDLLFSEQDAKVHFTRFIICCIIYAYLRRDALNTYFNSSYEFKTNFQTLGSSRLNSETGLMSPRAREARDQS